MESNEIMLEHDQIASAQPSDEDVLDGSVVQLVTFKLDDVEYGIEILAVHEILRIPSITRLPNTPSFIKGVLNLRGNVIPVVDVRERFGFTPAVITEQSRVIVIESDDKLIGLLVDNVSQVLRIRENNIDPPSLLIEGVSEEYIAGVGRLKERLIIILSMQNILFADAETKDRKDKAYIRA